MRPRLLPASNFAPNHSLSLALMAGALALTATALSQTIDLAQLGTTHPGLVINGARLYHHSGDRVSGMGDVKTKHLRIQITIFPCE
jgi:hypothetical protein